MPAETLTLHATDVSGQRAADISWPPESTVGELVSRLVANMKLPPNNAEGRPLVYSARLDREDRRLHSSERVSEAVKDGDHLVLQPTIEAGA